MQDGLLRISLIPLIFLLVVFPAVAAEQIPVTGDETPAAAPFDALMLDLLSRYGIEGGAVAVSRDGELVVSRGYGYANVSTRQPVQPDSLFRIASISKSFTAVAIMKLVETGQLNLDDHAFALLDFGYGSDPRIRDITIRHLLTHSAGWDREVSFDPLFAFGQASADEIIRQMLTRPLDFTPGMRFAYSNFGFCVLGRVIEQVTGQRYEDYVRDEILAPIGIESMRIGSRAGDAPGEVRYYGYGAYSLLPDVMDSLGGWIASAIDLVRFGDAVQGHGDRMCLKPDSVAAMVARPEPPLWEGSDQWYALGWAVVPVGRTVYIYHNGGMYGTASWLTSTNRSYTWAAVFNRWPAAISSFMGDLDRGLWQACRTAWPRPPSSRRKRPIVRNR